MLKAPFPYFGGKSLVASIIWDAIGQPAHYLEPFFGSGAVLLNRPNYDATKHTETICDKDGFVTNAWRAMQFDPEGLARVCDWPVNHADLSARRKKMIETMPGLLDKLVSDDEFFNLKIAGYWIWAASCWIGSGLTRPNSIQHLSTKGQGVHGTNTISPIPHLSNKGAGIQRTSSTEIYAWFRQLSERLRYVRVVCGDWSRICGGDWQDNRWPTVGIFFDPPYSEKAKRNETIYTEESLTVAHDVRSWAIERGGRKNYRIVIAGYEGEHEELESHGWSVKLGKANGGYGNTKRNNDSKSQGTNNRHKERLWFSPYCINNTSSNGSIL